DQENSQSNGRGHIRVFLLSRCQKTAHSGPLFLRPLSTLRQLRETLDSSERVVPSSANVESQCLLPAWSIRQIATGSRGAGRCVLRPRWTRKKAHEGACDN